AWRARRYSTNAASEVSSAVISEWSLISSGHRDCCSSSARMFLSYALQGLTCVILPTRTNRSVVISSLHDHDRGQAEGVRATVELDLRLATRSGLFDHPANAVLVHAEHRLDDGHRGHHHEVADSVDAVKLGHFCLVWIKVSMKQALISVHVVRTLLDKNRKITNRIPRRHPSDRFVGAAAHKVQVSAWNRGWAIERGFPSPFSFRGPVKPTSRSEKRT